MPNITQALNGLSVIIRWCFGGFWLLLGFIGMTDGNTAAGSFLIALGFLITPLSDKYLFNRLKWLVPTWVKVIFGFALLVGFGMTIPSLTIETTKSPTNQSPITVEVKYESGKTVKLYLNDKLIGEKQTNKNRSARFENITLMKGNNNFKAVVIDRNNNGATKKVVYDTAPPNKPHVSNLPNEIYEKNLKIIGISEANATIKIYFNGNQARTIKTNNEGKFSAEFILYQDKNSFQFEAIDEAGNSSQLTNTIKIVYVDKKKLEEEKAKTKQEAERTQEMAEKKVEAEKQQLQKEQIQKEKSRLEEEKRINLAKQYCDNRNKINSRYYPIPENKEECKINDKLNKRGVNLTSADCRVIIDCLFSSATKYASVTTIDINSVLERKYWIGMNVMELAYSLGIPNKINESDYGLGVNQQWIYYKDSYGASAYYIYVENSKVTSYQDF